MNDSARVFQLERNIVSVFLFPLAADAGAPSVLSAAECARAERFHQATHRDRYIAAHTALRNVLGRIAHLDPASLRFERGRYGKPHLAADQNALDLRFSLSDTESCGLIGVSAGVELGVDIEATRDSIGEDVYEIASRFYSHEERRCVLEAAPDRASEVFYRIWTRKEAYLKAIGVGLHHPLDAFDVAGPEEAFVDGYCVRSLPVANLPDSPACAAALAAFGKEWEYRMYVLPSVLCNGR